MGPDGYYDEKGFYHRAPPQPRQRPPPSQEPRVIRDPYYDQYRNSQVHYDQYGRPIVIRQRPSPLLRPVTERRRVRTRDLGMFSATEVVEIVVATLVLAVAFTLVQGNLGILLSSPIPLFIAFFPISLLATATSFTAHEVAHKFMAQKYGMPAEFVLNPIGIVVALATAAIFGFLFALPGAVVFSGAGADDRIVGKVGAAGPAMNIAVALVFFPFMLMYPILWIVVFVNVFLGGFNMIPFGDFDGLKIWRWNKALYAGMLAIIVSLLILAWFHVEILGV